MSVCVDILDVFDVFAFSVIDAPIEQVAPLIKGQGVVWNNEFVISKELLTLDARVLYYSPDGPRNMQSSEKGILLSEISGFKGKMTIFLSSVADGYASMIHVISKKLPGVHFSVTVSRIDIEYPGCMFKAVSMGDDMRIVYSSRDGGKWNFFEKGAPLEFEEPKNYSKRLKRERITPELIATYLGRIGYGSLQKSYWIDDRKPAILLTTTGFRIWPRE